MKHPPLTSMAVRIASAGHRAHHAAGLIPRPHGLMLNALFFLSYSTF